jgi:hypothetical protein
VRRWPRANPEYVFALDDRAEEPSMHEWHRWLREDFRPAVDARVGGLPGGWTGYWLRHAAINAALRNGLTAEQIADQFGNSAQVIIDAYAQAQDRQRHSVAGSLRKARRSRGE